MPRKPVLKQCPTCHGATWLICPQCRGNKLVPLAVLPLLRLREVAEPTEDDIVDARRLMRLEA